jgi:hypothetical protein
VQAPNLRGSLKRIDKRDGIYVDDRGSDGDAMTMSLEMIPSFRKVIIMIVMLLIIMAAVVTYDYDHEDLAMM